MKATKILPNRKQIKKILQNLRIYFFPGYFDSGVDLADIREIITNDLLVELSKIYRDKSAVYDILDKFVNHFDEIDEMLALDIKAAYDGDPAASSYDEVILSYPGFFTIAIYRIAHVLYELAVPLIPRMMTEIAHSATGIDIHPGASIGAGFFIDHGTGVVIGETTHIGDNVKLYQGVTLGALSTTGGQKLHGKKRHPTIGHNVTIYSGATILGGDTVIADGITIPGNSFITKSVEK